MERLQELRERLKDARNILTTTPVVGIPHEHIRLYTKLEYLNGIGSIKDRPAYGILNGAISRGDIRPDSTIIESSSGNLACALAVFCKVLGLNFIPVIDPLISPANEALLNSFCERVVKVRTADDGGYLKTRLRVIDELQSTIPGCYWTNQYNNPDGAEAHYALTGAEICSQLPDLEYAFIGVSSAGTIAGVSRRLKEHNPAIRIIAVDAEGSSIFGGAPKKRSIPGIGASIVPPLLRSAFIDDVVIVPECDTIAACHELLFRHAIFAGGSSGTAYSAVENYIATHDLPRGTKCLFLCCDRGTAYLKSIYDFACAPLAHVASPGGLPFR